MMDIFFAASKIGWLVIAPDNAIVLVLLAALVMSRFSRLRQGNRFGLI